MADAKPHDLHFSVSPGPETASQVAGFVKHSPEQGEYAGFSAEFMTQLRNSPLLCVGGGIPYVAVEGTETKDNSGTIVQVGGGLRFQTGGSPTANDDVTYRSARQVTLAAGMRLRGTIIVQESVASEVGLVFGVVTSSATEVRSANPADGIYLFSPNNANTLIMRVIENGAAADDLQIGTLADLTNARVSYAVDWDASGAVTVASIWLNGTHVAFTSDQKTALAAMLATTPPTLAGLVGMAGPNSTTQRHAIAQSLLLELA